jgi:hypothetical protein
VNTKQTSSPHREKSRTASREGVIHGTRAYSVSDNSNYNTHSLNFDGNIYRNTENRISRERELGRTASPHIAKSRQCSS